MTMKLYHSTTAVLQLELLQ